MWHTLASHTKGYVLSQLLLAIGIIGGVIQRTIEGSWDTIPAVNLAIYWLGGTMLLGTSGIMFINWVNHHELTKSTRAMRSIQSSHTRVQHHLDAETPRDKYGFLALMDWAAVADLEHDMGFAHMSESKPFCGRVSCWKEDQNPEYVMENGFLAIAAFPELPEEEPTHDQFGRRLKNVFSQPVSAAAPIEQLNARVGYLTMNEVRAMPVEPDPDIMDYKTQMEYLDEQLKAAVGAGHMSVATLDENMTMTERAYHWEEALKLKYGGELTATDRRRDDDPDELFQQALDSFKQRPSDLEEELGSPIESFFGPS